MNKFLMLVLALVISLALQSCNDRSPPPPPQPPAR